MLRLQVKGPWRDGRAGLPNAGGKETIGRLGEQQMADRGAAGRLAENGDAGGIAAKVADVRVHPLQRHHHVQHAHVTARLRRIQAHEAQRPDAIVDGHHDHIAPGGQPFRAHANLRAGVEGTAVNEKHDGQEGNGRRYRARWRPGR